MGGCRSRGYGCTLPVLSSNIKWEFLEAVWLDTSVSLAAMPAFHDSALHHLKHIIAFDDNKRIVARELSEISKNTALPVFQVQSTSADVVFQTQRSMRGATLEWLPPWASLFLVKICR